MKCKFLRYRVEGGKRKMGFIRIFWESLNEVMLIVGAIFVSFFFVEQSILKSSWLIYGIALVIIGVMSRYGLEKTLK